MAIEIVDFPIKKMVIFHCYVTVHQRVLYIYYIRHNSFMIVINFINHYYLTLFAYRWSYSFPIIMGSNPHFIGTWGWVKTIQNLWIYITLAYLLGVNESLRLSHPGTIRVSSSPVIWSNQQSLLEHVFFTWVCLKMGYYIPNEIAIVHRDNDQQNHWV